MGFGWTPVTLNQEISAADIENGNLLFTPDPSENGNGYATIDFKVGDGSDFSVAYTLTMNVNSVNDEPLAFGETLLNVTEDSGVRTISFASLLINDGDGDPEVSQDLMITGVFNFVGGTAEIDGANIRFTPTANYFGPAGFEYTIEDNGTTNGLADFKSSTAHAEFEITSVNDNPNIELITNVGGTDTSGAALTETDAGLSIGGTLTVTDVDLADTVSSSVTGVAVSGTGAAGLGAIAVLGMLGVTPAGAIGADPGTEHNLSWTFNSGGQAFDYLAAGQSLVLTYTVQSSDGNGGSDTQNVEITINGTDDNAAPATDLNGGSGGANNSASFTEDGGAVLIASAGTVTDLDDTNMESMTITLTNRPDGALEGLSLTGAAATAATNAGLTVTAYNSGTGVLSISGSATKTVYQTILQGVQYNNTDQTPDTTARSVTVVVNDGTVNSTTTTSTISVAAVDDAPTSIEFRVSTTGASSDGGSSLNADGLMGTFVAIGDPDSVGPFTYTLTGVPGAPGAPLYDMDGPGGTTSLSNTSGNLYVGNSGVAAELTSTFSVNVGGLSLAVNVAVLGTGDDALTGGAGIDILYGQQNGDTLNGAGGSDALIGGSGTDTLTGGTGNDVLLGGDNNDTYVFATTGDGNDTINEVSGSGTDRINITTANSSTVISGLGFERVDADGDAAIDDLRIDYNGQSITVINQYGSGTPVEQIAFTNGGTYLGYVLGAGAYDLNEDATGELTGENTGGPTIGDRDVIASSISGETLSGGNGNDILFGNGGNDILNGGDNSDLLVGGAGADTMSGGTGNDWLVGGTGADTFVIGTDTLTAGIQDTISDYSGFGVGGQNDVIDLTALLDLAAGTDLEAGGYVQLSGNNLQVDANGGANNWETVATFSGTSVTTGETIRILFDNGSGTQSNDNI